VGGSKYIYPLCKLLAAAIWKAHFSSSPLDPQAGRRLKRDLLQAGGQTHPSEVVKRLLGDDSLTPFHQRCRSRFREDTSVACSPNNEYSYGETAPADRRQQRGLGSDIIGEEGQGETSSIVGWLPNLQADVFQDIELLG
jgi:hypothetical protein